MAAASSSLMGVDYDDMDDDDYGDDDNMNDSDRSDDDLNMMDDGDGKGSK